MAGMTGDTGKMQQASQQVDEAAQLITGLKLKVDGQHQDLFSGWKSNAAGAYAQVHAAWDAQLTRILGNLNVIHENLTGTGVNYGTNDADQAMLANQLSGLLNPQ